MLVKHQQGALGAKHIGTLRQQGQHSRTPQDVLLKGHTGAVSEIHTGDSVFIDDFVLLDVMDRGKRIHKEVCRIPLESLLGPFIGGVGSKGLHILFFGTVVSFVGEKDRSTT